MRIEDDILEWARKDPGRLAIATSGRTLTYGELKQETGRWALQLQRDGLQEGGPVWLCMANCIEFIAAALAVWRAGGVVVPVNPRLTHHELHACAEKCHPSLVVGDASTCAALRILFPDSAGVRIALAADGEALQIEPAAKERAGISERTCTLTTQTSTPGVVYFTSGSTGRPKGILLRHDSIAANARSTAQAFELQPDDRTLVCMPVCHSYTLTKQMLAHFHVGACLVLAPGFFRPAVILEWLARFDVTTLCAVPSMYAMLYEQMVRTPQLLPTLRLLVSGGAPMLDRVQRGLCECLPEAAFISSYGLSEAGPCVTVLPPKWALSKLGSVGRAISGVQVHIIGENGRALPAGSVGELCVRGPNVMERYLDDPVATARALQDGWLRTGDVGWQDADDCIYLCGRHDDLILRGGENVYPAEIENVLCTHPQVLEAGVIGVSHALLGQDVIAYVRLRDNIVDPDNLRAHCRKHLADFKVPREIRVVQSLPHTSNGKLSRLRLRQAEACGSVSLKHAAGKEFAS